MKYYDNIYKKRRRRKAKFLAILFSSFVVCVILYVYLVVNPIVVEASRQMVFSLSTSAVSDAIYDVLSQEGVKYEDLVDVQRDSSGNVTMISLQTVRLNLIARKFYQVAQVYLDRMGNIGVDVPLGAFTGLPFLVGFGPKVNIKLMPIGAMTSTFENSFTSAGINQTNHSLYIHLHASVSMILPAYSKTIDSETEMLVCESVIVGNVPEIYFAGGLNFSPN